jgi:hypothetical protein
LFEVCNEPGVCGVPCQQLAGQRQSIIAANTGLQERELIKLASLSSAIAGTLRRRAVTEPAASLTGEQKEFAAGVPAFADVQCGAPVFEREGLGDRDAELAVGCVPFRGSRSTAGAADAPAVPRSVRGCGQAAAR